MRSAVITQDVLALSLSGKAIKIYAVLERADFISRGKWFRYSIKSLAGESGLSESGVKLALGELTERGIIHSRATYGGGRRHANRYRLTFRGSRDAGYVYLDLELVRSFSARKLLVYLAILARSNRYGVSYASERAIAKATGISRTTVRKYTAELEAQRILKRYARLYAKYEKTRARRSFVYTFDVPAEESAPLLATQELPLCVGFTREAVPLSYRRRKPQLLIIRPPP